MQEKDKKISSRKINHILENPVLRVVLSVLFFAAVAALGALFSDTSSEWYLSLTKPSLQPPDIIFPVVWTVLYIMLAVSLSLLTAGPKTDKKILYLYAANGILNILWSYAFFEKQNPAGAFFILILILIAAISLSKYVLRVNKTAAYLLLPYIIWLWFSLYLNYEIAFFN